ncbi:MAG: Gfo/Idh/MocA family oxidoreductase, partial [Bryocella sp.]
MTSATPQNSSDPQPLRVGHVGLGYWGPNIVRVLSTSSTCQLAGLCDLSAAHLSRFAGLYPGVPTYQDFQQLLDSDVEAVTIATPISTHYELARRALMSGKHVFVEKPLSHTSGHARKLVALAAEKGLTLFTGHTFIYSPAVIKVKEMIDAGELGDLHYISLSRVNLGLYQKDVDVVWDLAVHDISILLYWLNESPIRGASFGRACVQNQKRDVAFLWFEFPSGLVASNEISWISPQKMRRTCVVGSRRMVVYDDTDPNEKLKVYDRGVDFKNPETFGEFQLSYRIGDMHAPYLGNAEPLALEM